MTPVMFHGLVSWAVAGMAGGKAFEIFQRKRAAARARGVPSDGWDDPVQYLWVGLVVAIIHFILLLLIILNLHGEGATGLFLLLEIPAIVLSQLIFCGWFSLSLVYALSVGSVLYGLAAMFVIRVIGWIVKLA